MAKYNEIMSRVSVTPAMRERILTNVAGSRQTAGATGAEAFRGLVKESGTGKTRGSRYRFMKWIPAVAAACIMIIAGMQYYRMNHVNPASPGTDSDVAAQGIEEYASIEELEKAAGFDMPELADLPFTVTGTAYTNAFGIARCDYYGADGENLTISKAVDDGSDISGDYTEYAVVTEETIGGVTVTFKGNGDSLSLATWADSGYAYAIDMMQGMSMEDMKGIVEDVISDARH